MLQAAGEYIYYDMLYFPALATAQHVDWLNYLGDLDADFLRFYGIDLETEDISSVRFFSLAERTFAYGGVMTKRAEKQAEDTGSRPSPSRSVPDENEVSLEQFAALSGYVTITKAG